MPHSNYGMLFDPPSGEVFVPPIGNEEEFNQDSAEYELQEEWQRRWNREKYAQDSTTSTKRSDGNYGTRASAQIADEKDYDAQRERKIKRHYLKETFKNQGLSIAYCAKKMGISVEEAIRQMDPEYNLSLRQMFAWSEALDVPLPELLPFDSRTSDPIRNRGLLLRIVKTARTIQNLSKNTPVQYAAQTLVDQLLELIPEYANVEPWPTVGKSRAAKSEGVAARPIDSDLSRFIEENR